MKRLIGITAAALCSFVASPANALPTYAIMVAQDHCEYLRYGWSWDDASAQALSDNIHWLDEMNADGDRAGGVISIAINKECQALNRAAWDAR